jgi:hypothetical protein
MKSTLRFSKASGSTRRRVDLIIQRGWFPGVGRVSDFYKGRSRRNRMEADSHAD